jgi:hypothetical protein
MRSFGGRDTGSASTDDGSIASTRPAGRAEDAGKRKPGSWAIRQPPNTCRHPDRQRSPIAPQSLPGRVSCPRSTSNVASLLLILNGGSCPLRLLLRPALRCRAGARSAPSGPEWTLTTGETPHEDEAGGIDGWEDAANSPRTPGGPRGYPRPWRIQEVTRRALAAGKWR